MPPWLVPLIQSLPAILAAIDQIIKDIGDKPPTPAQLSALHDLSATAREIHTAAMNWSARQFGAP